MTDLVDGGAVNVDETLNDLDVLDNDGGILNDADLDLLSGILNGGVVNGDVLQDGILNGDILQDGILTDGILNGEILTGDLLSDDHILTGTS